MWRLYLLRAIVGTLDTIGLSKKVYSSMEFKSDFQIMQEHVL